MIAVVGIGNPLRADDGAGPRAAEFLRCSLPEERVSVVASPCDPGRLFDAVDGCEAAFILDACTGGEPGEVHVWAGDPRGLAHSLQAHHFSLSDGAGAASSHGFGLVHAIELGCSLGALPPRLWVVAVSGSSFELGEPMSRPVRLGAIRAAWCVIGEVSQWLSD
ncbi:MAG TPA: hydrogenase maturation protease [Fimbriimonas sp.]